MTTTDHKRIGILYLLTSLAYFGVSPACLSRLIRTQLARPDNTFVTSHEYAQLFTLHGTAMIFLVRRAVRARARELSHSPANRRGRYGVSAAQRDVVLDVSLRRARRVSRCRDERGRRGIGLVRVSASLGDSSQHRSRPRSLDRRRVPRLGRDDSHLDQFRDDRLHLPRAGNDDVADPDLHVGNGRDVALDLHGVSVARGDALTALRRPPFRRPRVRSGVRRRSRALATSLLVLRAPRSVRDDLARTSV